MLIGERHGTRYDMQDVLFRFFDGNIAAVPYSVAGSTVRAKTAVNVWNAAFNPYITGQQASQVKDVVLYDGRITSVGVAGFYGSSLYSFISLYKFQDLKNTVTNIGNSAFYNCVNLQKIQLHGVEQVGMYAFAQCSNLREIPMENLKSVGSYAFYRCTALQNADFPTCQTVGSYAFQSCTGMTTASFPAATRLERGAFSSCTALQNVYLLGSSVVGLGDNKTFSGCPATLKVYVPASLYNQYVGSQFWKQQQQYLVSYV